MDLKKGTLVKVSKTKCLNDRQIDPVLLNSRKSAFAFIDSPVYLTYNKLWVVKHINLKKKYVKKYKGIPLYEYAVYQLEEIEILPINEKTEVIYKELQRKYGML
mgnify:CR=1 FL=1